jgi:hypothetical protein
MNKILFEFLHPNFYNIYVLIIVLIINIYLSVMDNYRTNKTMKLYKLWKPKDNKWYNNELSYIHRLLFKIGKENFGLFISLSVLIVFTIVAYIYNDYLFFLFSGVIFGGLYVANKIHKENLRDLKEKLK